MKRIYTVLFLLFFLISTLTAKEFNKQTTKKISKIIKSSFKTDEYQLRDRSEISIDSIPSQYIKGIEFNKLYIDNEFVAYVIFAESQGRNDFFDYMLILNKDFSIKKVSVIIYRSMYGGEITAKSWLRQFEGKKITDDIVYESGIDVCSGATVSGPRLVNGVNVLLKLAMSKYR
ncbi:MAG: FMN-binding protein [Marinifilaceae bacterium]|jgi:hypothetical protein|nr:FMN-binding protein [Marinifilaceae bacterium]